MRSSVSIIFISLLSFSVAAQQKQSLAKDTLPARIIQHKSTSSRSVKRPLIVEAELTEKLNAIASTYTTKPNIPSTWTSMKVEVYNLLFGYWQRGDVLGKTVEQAFFVKIGNDTMTPTDIARHKMILQVGFAHIKPAEFKIVIVEKINTAL